MPPRETGGQGLREQVAEAIFHLRMDRIGEPVEWDYAIRLGFPAVAECREEADAAIAAYREHEQGEERVVELEAALTGLLPHATNQLPGSMPAISRARRALSAVPLLQDEPDDV